MRDTENDILFTDCYEYAFNKAKDETNFYGFSTKRTIRLVHDIALELIEKGTYVKDALPDYDNGSIKVILHNQYSQSEVSYLDIFVNQAEPAKTSPFVAIKETAQITLGIDSMEVGKPNHPFGPYTKEHWKTGDNMLGQDIFNFGTFSDDLGIAMRVVNRFNTIMKDWQKYVQSEKEAFGRTLE